MMYMFTFTGIVIGMKIVINYVTIIIIITIIIILLISCMSILVQSPPVQSVSLLSFGTLEVQCLT